MGRLLNMPTRRPPRNLQIPQRQRIHQNYHDSWATIPLPSSMVTSLLAGTRSRTAVLPLNQRTSTRAERTFGPRPKCDRKSFCEQKLPPLLTSCIIRCAPTLTMTLEPMADLLLFAPMSLTSSHEFDDGLWLRSSEGISLILFTTRSSCPVWNKSPTASPRPHRDSANALPDCAEMSSNRPLRRLRKRRFLPLSGAMG